jgi:hypothetical protein
MLQPKYTIELFDVPHECCGDKTQVGYRVTSYDDTGNGMSSDELVTDADYLAYQLEETLSKIGRVVPKATVNYSANSGRDND